MLADNGLSRELAGEMIMRKKIKYSVRYRSDQAPRGSYITVMIDAESESEAIEKIRKQQPKATEIVAKPK